MDDLISRQAALDISMKYCSDDNGSCSEPHTDLREMLDEIENLPSAQKKGHWVKAEGMQPPEYHGGYFCSECEGWAPRDWKHYKLMLSSHCPHCGADMKGDNDV